MNGGNSKEDLKLHGRRKMIRGAMNMPNCVNGKKQLPRYGRGLTSKHACRLSAQPSRGTTEDDMGGSVRSFHVIPLAAS